MRRINIALSDPQRGMRDLYGKMSLPGLLGQPLGDLLHSAAAREQAAAIAYGMPHIFFLLSTEDSQRLLFLLMDADVVVVDNLPLTGMSFTGQQLKDVFVPLATFMSQHMLRLGFGESEIRERMVAILNHPNITEEVSLAIRQMTNKARLRPPVRLMRG